jgi:uncharacterized protein YoxC
MMFAPFGIDLSHLDDKLDLILSKGDAMTAALDKLTQEVEETKTAVDSAITLIGGLAQQIRDLKDDPAKLEALANELDAKQKAIADAVAANTEPPAEEE